MGQTKISCHKGTAEIRYSVLNISIVSNPEVARSVLLAQVPHGTPAS